MRVAFVAAARPRDADRLRAGLRVAGSLSGSAVCEAPKQPPNCQTDAMLVFDASGSIAGMGFGEKPVTRIEQVRRALATVLPSVAPVRNLGLITFGPGTRRECDNIQLRLRPTPNAAERILEVVDTLQPYGETPITKAVSEAGPAWLPPRA